MKALFLTSVAVLILFLFSCKETLNKQVTLKDNPTTAKIDTHHYVGVIITNCCKFNVIEDSMVVIDPDPHMPGDTTRVVYLPYTYKKKPRKSIFTQEQLQCGSYLPEWKKLQ